MTTRVGILPNLGSGSLLVMIRGLLATVTKVAPSALELTLILGSTSVALLQSLAPVALGQDSTFCTSCAYTD